MRPRLKAAPVWTNTDFSGILYVNRTGQMLLNIPVASALRTPLVLTYENRYLNSLPILLHYSRGDLNKDKMKPSVVAQAYISNTWEVRRLTSSRLAWAVEYIMGSQVKNQFLNGKGKEINIETHSSRRFEFSVQHSCLVVHEHL